MVSRGIHTTLARFYVSIIYGFGIHLNALEKFILAATTRTVDELFLVCVLKMENE